MGGCSRPDRAPRCSGGRRRRRLPVCYAIDNLLPGTAVGDGLIDVIGQPQRLDRCIATNTDLPPGTAVLWCVRPNQVVIGSDGRYPARVTDVIQLGTSAPVTVRLEDGPELRAWMPSSGHLEVGDPCGVNIEPDAVSVWAAPGPEDLSPALEASRASAGERLVRTPGLVIGWASGSGPARPGRGRALLHPLISLRVNGLSRWGADQSLLAFVARRRDDHSKEGRGHENPSRPAVHSRRR